MELILSTIREHFVLIVIFILALILIRFVARSLLTILGGLLIVGVLLYLFTDDMTFLNKTVDSSAKAVQVVKEEVQEGEFNRTSDTTFEIKTKSMRVLGDEETKLAKVVIGEKSIDLPLSTLYKLVTVDMQKQINIET